MILFGNSILVIRMHIVPRAAYVGMALYSWIFVSDQHVTIGSCLSMVEKFTKLAGFESPYNNTGLPPAHGHGYKKYIKPIPT